MADNTIKAPRAPGSVEFFLGPMFSGKTTEVSRMIKRARLGGLNCVFIKNAADSRYGDGPIIYTHDGSAISASPAGDGLGWLRIEKTQNLLDVELGPDEFDIGIDEGQFYPDLRQALDIWMREGRRMYVAALDGDFRRIAFPPITEAFSLATRITKLTAVCMICAGWKLHPAEAPYTILTVGASTVNLIGARDKYKAACPACYLAHAAKLQETADTAYTDGNKLLHDHYSSTNVMDKKKQRYYDDMVASIMASLDANYMALKRHPYIRGTRIDEYAAGQVADLLNRSVPVTEFEKIVAATFRWIANKHRGAFIKSMFEGRFACVCQYVDDRMIETGLCSEGTFSVNTTPHGYRIGESYLPPHNNVHAPHRSRKKGGRRRNTYYDNGGEEPRGVPVLNENARRKLQDELDHEVGNVAVHYNKIAAMEEGISHLALGTHMLSPEPATPSMKVAEDAAPLPFTTQYSLGTNWVDMVDSTDEDFSSPRPK